LSVTCGKYGNEFRVLRADSGAAALEILKQLKLRNEPPAFFLVDKRMSNMTGVEFLEQAMVYFLMLNAYCLQRMQTQMLL
jgi:thioredoxin reductase (NADPH)